MNESPFENEDEAFCPRCGGTFSSWGEYSAETRLILHEANAGTRKHGVLVCDPKEERR